MYKMSDVRRLLDRQLGFPSRLDYDSALRRLAVRADESYYGLAGAESAHVPDPADQDPPIFACRFAEVAGYEHILALANEDGRVSIQNTSNEGGGSLDGFQCHNNAVFDLAWRPHHLQYVTVSGDHTACLWDIGTGTATRISMFVQHTRSVKTGVFAHSGSVLATGGRDGHVLVWDVRARQQTTQQLDNTLRHCHSSFLPKTPGSHGKRARLDTPRVASVTGLVFQDDVTLLSCGECDGNIKVWDLRKNYSVYKREPLPKYSIPYCGSSSRNGYSDLIVDASRHRLYASCMDSVVYCFNLATYNPRPERRYLGHEASSFYIKMCLSPDGRYLVSGSSDNHAYIWSVRQARPIVRLTGHRAEVTGAAWSAGATLGPVATCSDDARHKLWRIHPEWDEQTDECELKGRAEELPPLEPASPTWRTRTPPKSTQRAVESRRPPRSGPSTRTKRCLATLMGVAKRPKLDTDASSPTTSAMKRAQHLPDDCKSPKRRCLEAADQPLLPAGIKRKSTGDEASPRKRQCLSPAPSTSHEPNPPNNYENNGRTEAHTPPKNYEKKDSKEPKTPPRSYENSSKELQTPPKNYEKNGSKLRSPRSPRPKTGSPSKATSSVSTITTVWLHDLPDYVATGEAPHLRLMSPIKPRAAPTPDWLTALRRARVPLAPSLTPHSPPQPQRRLSTSEKAQKPKARTLLKYFTVTEK